MARLDLDSARAARAEKQEEFVIAFGGRDYTLPAEMPLEFAEHLVNVQLRAAMATLLDDEDLDEFMAAKPSLDDVAELAQAYGFSGLGESRASRSSSPNGSRSSRPTSRRTTT